MRSVSIGNRWGLPALIHGDPEPECASQQGGPAAVDSGSVADSRMVVLKI